MVKISLNAGASGRSSLPHGPLRLSESAPMLTSVMIWSEHSIFRGLRFHLQLPGHLLTELLRRQQRSEPTHLLLGEPAGGGLASKQHRVAIGSDAQYLLQAGDAAELTDREITERLGRLG